MRPVTNEEDSESDGRWSRTEQEAAETHDKPPPAPTQPEDFFDRRMGYGTVGGFIGCLIPIVILIAVVVIGLRDIYG